MNKFKISNLKGKQFVFPFLFLILLSLHVKSQNDFESWNSINLDYKILPKTTIWNSTEFRFYDNASRLKKAMLDFGVSQNLKNGFEATFAYRYSRFDDNSIFKNEHMFIGNMEYEYKIDRFTLTANTRLQRSYIVMGLSNLDETDNVWRNKASVNYNIYQSPLTPYLSYELFTDINAFSNVFLQKSRLFGGCKYKIDKLHSIAAFYGIQTSFRNDERSFILGLKYSFNIRNTKEKDN